MREDLLVFTGINILLAWSFWVVFSAGQISLGNGAFMALGAYASSVLTVKFGWPLLPSLIVAAVGTALVGVIVGVTAIRTRGVYLVMLTFAIGEIVQVALVNFAYTGGFRGFTGMRGASAPLVLGALVLVGLALHQLMRSPVGKAFEAVRNDELGAAAAGLSVVTVRLTSFGLGAAIAALAGGLYAHYILFIRPDQFGIIVSIWIALYVIFGGVDNLLGPALGALVITLLPEAVRPLQEWKNVAFGAAIVALLTVRPNGLLTRAELAALRRLWTRRAPSRAEPEPEPVAPASQA
jgi:branched-chain amino acid transport system permease protein